MDAPARLRSRLAIDATDIYNEADLWTDALYDFSLAATPLATLATVRTSIARGIVDVNRPPDDLENPDGAIKAISSYGRQTFDPPLATPEKQQLIADCWLPWHTAMLSALRQSTGAAKLLLDCHTMAQRGPTTYAFAGAARPFICIANLGDEEGEMRQQGLFSGAVSSPAWFLRKAGEIAAELFADLSLLEPDGEVPPAVALNWPFAGGYIVKRYTALANAANPLPEYDPDASAPWSLMVEINRGLYVGNQNASTPIAPPNLERISAVRDRLAAWIQALCTYLPT
jgi:N-formylglutamate amidohydrolase